MQRAAHGTTLGSGPKQRFLSFSVFLRGEVEYNVDLPDAARVGVHSLFHLIGGAVDVEFMTLRADAHDGHHTAGEGRASEVGGREGFAFAVVVGGCIGEDGVPRLHVGHLIAEIAFVGSFDCCHNDNVLLGTALRQAQGPEKVKVVEPVETPTLL